MASGADVCWQKILALDARYSAYRMANNPQFKTLYRRRRLQLLRSLDCNNIDPKIRENYLRIRTRILTERFANVDTSSWRSTTSSTTDSDRRVGSVPRSPLARRSLSPLDERGNRLRRPTVAQQYTFSGMHHIFDQHKLAVNRIAFAEDNLMAMCSDDHDISICSVNPRPAVIRVLHGHYGPVVDLSWSVTNDLLLSASQDGTVRLWMVSTGACLRVIEDPGMSMLAVAANNFSPVHQLTRSRSGGVSSRPCEVSCCALHPVNNNLFVMGNAKGQIHLINVSTGKVCTSRLASSSGVTCLTWDNHGKLLWTGDSKGFITSFTYHHVNTKLAKTRRHPIRDCSTVTSLAFKMWLDHQASPSLLVSAAPNQLLLFNVITPQNRLVLFKSFQIRHEDPMRQIRSSFAPLIAPRIGACVLSGSEDGAVCLFDTATQTGSSFFQLHGHSAPVLDVLFNFDESLLASSDSQGTVILWKRCRPTESPVSSP